MMKRMDYLDSWRGMGCLMVFASHMLSALKGKWGNGSFLGKSGVAVLFTLSAYLLCELYYWNEKKIDIRWSINFLKKRIIRIFPPLLFTCFIAVLLHRMTVEMAVRQCLMLEQYSHFWVLPLEIGFYLIFPILVLVMKKIGELISIIAGCVVIAGIWCYYLFFAPVQQTGSFIYCLPMFILGIVISLANHGKQTFSGGGKSIRNIDIFCGICVVAFECFGFIVYNILEYDDSTKISRFLADYLEIFRFIVGPFIFAGCLFLIVTGSRLQELLGGMKWMKKFGKISYSFYLIHYIILGTASSIVQRYDMNGILISLFVFSTSILAASIMYWGIEVKLGKMLAWLFKTV